jgi:hypothetical protein
LAQHTGNNGKGDSLASLLPAPDTQEIVKKYYLAIKGLKMAFHWNQNVRFELTSGLNAAGQTSFARHQDLEKTGG